MPESNHTTPVEYLEIPRLVGYRIGEDGSVWSCLEQVCLGAGGGTRVVIGTRWRRLRSNIRNGYLAINLNGKAFLIHRLVLEAFVGPCPEGMEACHNDGNRSNNHASNLRWDTRKNNHADKLQHGTSQRGDKNGSVKLTEDRVRDIRSEYACGRVSQLRLAAKHNVSPTLIYNIVHRKAWKYLV